MARYEKMDAKHKIILTTEKDAVRLEKFGNLLGDSPVFVLPIKHRFLFDEGPAFNQRIVHFIESFHLNPNNN
jgi:tetraacyldisaccharide 4'-kinase